MCIRDRTDPVKKHKLLLEAQAQYPDCLEVAQELLFLGRLYERCLLYTSRCV